MQNDQVTTDTSDPRELRLTLHQKAFFKSEVAQNAEAELKLMAKDPKYNTRETFTAKLDQQSFVQKHMMYLSEHPKLDPRHYLANLRLMTKIRG